jgi:hypothetical protein
MLLSRHLYGLAALALVTTASPLLGFNEGINVGTNTSLSDTHAMPKLVERDYKDSSEPKTIEMRLKCLHDWTECCQSTYLILCLVLGNAVMIMAPDRPTSKGIGH